MNDISFIERFVGLVMGTLGIIVSILAVIAALITAIYYSTVLYEKYKRKYKIVSAGFTSSPDFPERKGCVYIVPHMTIEKYDDTPLQILKAEFIYKDRYGRKHRFEASSIDPSETTKTTTVKLYDFFIAESLWRDLDNDVFVTKKGRLTFQIKDGKGKTTKFEPFKKNKKRKIPQPSDEVSAGYIEILDNNRKPTGVKIPISGIKESRDIVPVVDVDFNEVLSGSTINGKIEKGEIISINGVSYKISFANYEKDKEARKCPTCGTRLYQRYLRELCSILFQPETRK